MLSFRTNTRVVLSERGGMGKTMFVKRKTKDLTGLINNGHEQSAQNRSTFTKDDVLVTVSVHDVEVCTDDIVEKLCQYEEKHANKTIPRIYHFDIAPLVSYSFLQRGDSFILYYLRSHFL